jgi:hypothetical protein
MKFLTRTFISWLPLGIAVTLVCLLVYATVQQDYRQSLNDPQIQMAEDAAAKLAAGARPSDVVPDPDSVNIVSSLSPWLAIYNGDGVSVVSSGVLNGGIPQLPQGVFAAARANAGKDTTEPYEDRITWQFAAGVRQAVVVAWEPKTNQYIASGRNMREVEDREGDLSTLVAIAWIVTMAATFVTQCFVQYVL